MQKWFQLIAEMQTANIAHDHDDHHDHDNQQHDDDHHHLNADSEQCVTASGLPSQGLW